MADEREVLCQRILNIDKRLFTLLRAGVQSDFLQSDLTMPQLKVLLLLASDESQHLRMGQLAHALRVTLPTTTGIVDRLVEQCIIYRQEDPRDRRLVVVSLTESGRELVDRLISADRRRLAAVIGRLDLEGLRTVARAFHLMYEAVLAQTQEEAAAQPSRATLDGPHATGPVT